MPTNLGREDVFIIYLFLYPCQEVVDVFWSSAFDWLLHSLTVCPAVLESGWKREIEGEWREVRERKLLMLQTTLSPYGGVLCTIFVTIVSIVE